jgi:hypothetical protein
MVKIKKSVVWVKTHTPGLEPVEEFDRKKIEMALVRAGAGGPEVAEIAAKVKPVEGMTTDEIDKVVVAELEKKDPVAAKYWKIKRDYQRSRF